MARPIQRLVYPPELARHVKADVRPRPLERGLLRQGNQCLSFRDASGGAQEYQNNSCSDDGKRRHSSRCPRPVLGLSMGMAETCASTLLRAGYCPRWKDDIPGYLQAEAPWNHRRIRGTVQVSWTPLRVQLDEQPRGGAHQGPLRHWSEGWQTPSRTSAPQKRGRNYCHSSRSCQQGQGLGGSDDDQRKSHRSQADGGAGAFQLEPRPQRQRFHAKEFS